MLYVLAYAVDLSVALFAKYTSKVEEAARTAYGLLVAVEVAENRLASGLHRASPTSLLREAKGGSAGSVWAWFVCTR